MVTDILTLTVRMNDYRGTIVFQKQTPSPDIIADAGGWDIIIQPEDTKDLPYKPYVYDIELNMSGVIQTVIPISPFSLDKEVTY